MTDQAKTYRDEMNRLEPQLTPADRAYFSDLRVYASASSLWVSETALNQALLSMMQDLIEAAAAGETAVQLFGDDPKAMADAVLAQLPKPRLRDTAELGLIVLCMSWFFLLLSGGQATAAGLRISLLAVLLTPVIEGALILAVFGVIRATTFPRVRWLASRRGAGLTIAALVALGLAALVAVYVGLPHVWAVTLPTPWNLIVIGVSTLAFLVFEWGQHDRNSWPMMVLVVVLAGVALIEQVDASHPVSLTTWSLWFGAGLVLTAIVAFAVWTRRRDHDQ